MRESEWQADLIIMECLKKIPSQEILLQAGFVYANTDNEAIREVMERVIVRLMREEGLRHGV